MENNKACLTGGEPREVHVKSPTRVDFSGGTLDCWPLAHLLDELCCTVNLSINIFTEVHLSKRDDKKICIEVKNLNYKRGFSQLEACLNSQDKELFLLKPHLYYWQPDFGLNLVTSSQSPIGGGLGGSSSLCISLIKAFSQCLHKELSFAEMVTLGCNMEVQMLKTPTGTQDYYPAISPGLHIIKYGIDGTHLESLNLDEDFFESRMILVYTGKPHHSGINNWQVIKSAVEGDSKTLEYLSLIAQISFDVSQVCRERQWDQLPPLLQKEFYARTQLNPLFTSPEIQKLHKLVVQSGADALKICGAGGGGCVMVWVSPEARSKVIEECQKNHFHVMEIKPVWPTSAYVQ